MHTTLTLEVDSSLAIFTDISFALSNTFYFGKIYKLTQKSCNNCVQENIVLKKTAKCEMVTLLSGDICFSQGLISESCLNSLRPSDAYMRQQTNHPWFR